MDFTITGHDGRPVTSYDVEHETRLHLIVVRRDFTGFQHVHPVLDGAETWSADLDLTPGDWRLYADFRADGADALTLGTDLAAVPSRGGYRLFLDFKHLGVVRTAEFTVGTLGTERATDPAAGEEQDDAHDH